MMGNKYNEHSTFLAEVALAVLEDNKEVLDVNGVKEIIALYLMIPYMPSKALAPPDECSFIPKIEGAFCKGVDMRSLRDTIAHSFVTVEANDDSPNSSHGKVLIFDDRAFYSNRQEHERKGLHSKTCCIPISYTHDRLVQLASMVVNTHKRKDKLQSKKSSLHS